MKSEFGLTSPTTASVNRLHQHAWLPSDATLNQLDCIQPQHVSVTCHLVRLMLKAAAATEESVKAHICLLAVIT